MVEQFYRETERQGWDQTPTNQYKWCPDDLIQNQLSLLLIYCWNSLLRFFTLVIRNPYPSPAFKSNIDHKSSHCIVSVVCRTNFHLFSTDGSCLINTHFNPSSPCRLFFSMGNLDGRTYLKTDFSPAADSSLRDLLPLLAVKTDSEMFPFGVLCTSKHFSCLESSTSRVSSHPFSKKYVRIDSQSLFVPLHGESTWF